MTDTNKWYRNCEGLGTNDDEFNGSGSAPFCHTERVQRWIDGAASVIALLFAAPLFVGIAVVLRLAQGSPVLFRQRRLGRGGQAFELLKFRTMTDEYGDDGLPLSDAERITPLGRILRSTSLDELPEFWNVLRGEMSLVGPRPLPVAYRDRFTSAEARRFEVRPGITGWAQVNGRNSVHWDERLAMDVWYVEHQTTWLNIRILVLTIAVVLRRQGIALEGSATMEELRPLSERTSEGL